MAEVKKTTLKITRSDEGLISNLSAFQTVDGTKRHSELKQKHIPNALLLGTTKTNQFEVKRQDHWTDYKNFKDMIAAFKFNSKMK